MSMLEFKSEAELRAHYKGIRFRMRAARAKAAMREKPPLPSQKSLIEILMAAPPPFSNPLELRQPGVRAAQLAVASYYQIDVREMTSIARKRSICRPRQVAMFLCREVLKKSFPDIGARFGNRDHTTVMHAYGAISALIKSDADLAQDVEALTRILTE